MTFGPRLINPIITLAPNALSTWQPPHNEFYTNYDYFMVGEVWEDPGHLSDFGGEDGDGISPLDVKDLACPTWGLGKTTAADGTVTLTIGPPWLPLIVPPQEMFTLDPTWASACTGIFTGAYELTTFALFDPPIALTPTPLLLPTPIASPTPTDPTKVSERPSNSAVAARPASLPNDPAIPATTGNPERESPKPSPATGFGDADPGPPASKPGSPATSPDIIEGPPSDPASDSPSDPPPSDPEAPAIVEDPPTDPMASSSIDPDLPSDDQRQSSPDPKVPIVSMPIPGGNSQAQIQGLGAIIYNAFGKSGLEVDGSSPNSPPPESIFTINAQTFTANPIGFTVNNVAVTPGGIAHTVDGTRISLDQSGVLAIGTNNIPLMTPVPSTVLLVAGQTITANPSAFTIADTTISAGGTAVKINGTTVSLDKNGELEIDGSPISLPTPSHIYPAVAYTVAGQTFTPNPSAFSIAGTRISVGGPAATVDGTVISLEPSGTLIIGSSTIPLLTSPVSSDVNLDGFHVQEHSSFVVVDGVTLSPAAPGVTISGTIVGLEAGGATLDVGTGRFALPTPTEAANGLVDGQAFVGGQEKGRLLSVSLICGFGVGTLILLAWHGR